MQRPEGKFRGQIAEVNPWIFTSAICNLTSDLHPYFELAAALVRSWVWSFFTPVIWVVTSSMRVFS